MFHLVCYPRHAAAERRSCGFFDTLEEALAATDSVVGHWTAFSDGTYVTLGPVVEGDFNFWVLTPIRSFA